MKFFVNYFRELFCNHEFEKQIFRSNETSRVYGNTIVMICKKCGCIKKKCL